MKSRHYIAHYCRAAVLAVVKAPALIVFAGLSILVSVRGMLAGKPPRTYDPDEYEL